MLSNVLSVVLRGCGPIAAALLLQGCTTVPTVEQRTQAGVLTDIRNMQEDINRVNGRQDQLEAATDELRTSMRALCAAETDGKADVEKRFAVVDGRLKSAEDAREADKREMIEKLSRTIADVINKYRGSGDRESTSSGGIAENQALSGGRGAGAIRHVVKEKETLSAIAQQYGVTVDAIVGTNRLRNANLVRVGQTLIIPR